MIIEENFPLQSLNTFGMQVSARWFTAVRTIEELQEVYANEKWKADNFILVGGSNILFTKNVNALVVRNELRGIEVVKEDDEFVYVKSGAGEVWHEFVLDCIRNNRGGVENLSLIPGSVGSG